MNCNYSFIQFGIFSVVFIFSLCVLISISFHVSNFKGHCLLFTNGSWKEVDGKFVANWGSTVYCGYDIALAAVSLVLSCFQIKRFLMHMKTSTEVSFLGAFYDVAVSLVMCIATLTSALMITLGFVVWCDAIMLRFEKCEDATSNDIMDENGINTSHFYTNFGTAQYGAWGLWLCYVGLSVTAFLRICRIHQLENIRASVTSDRRNLVTE